MIPRGHRGRYLYDEAMRIAAEGKDVHKRCQKLAFEAMRSGLSQKAAFRHIARALQNVAKRIDSQS